jgi:hypothetical protein
VDACAHDVSNREARIVSVNMQKNDVTKRRVIRQYMIDSKS